MSDGDEDDKPTVILDLNALKNQKLKQEEDLANIASELEFNVSVEPTQTKNRFVAKNLEISSSSKQQNNYTVILFDFQSDFFNSSLDRFPKGPSYHVAKDLTELNKYLNPKEFQIVVLNYDVNAKAVNQLTAQINQKFPKTKTIIMSRNISAQKAQVHATTPSGANAYYQFPIDTDQVQREFDKIYTSIK